MAPFYIGETENGWSLFVAALKANQSNNEDHILHRYATAKAQGIFAEMVRPETQMASGPNSDLQESSVSPLRSD